MDNGGCEVEFGGLGKGEKEGVHPDFSENWGGWGNKKAAEKRPARY